jgi:4-oxalocrotonate tautomerase
MPIVHVYLWTGRSAAEKKQVIEGITKVLAGIRIPPEAVDVVLHDVPKENWGVGGTPASEKFANMP